MTPTSSYLLGSGLICALGAHSATSITAIVAGLSRLHKFSVPEPVDKAVVIANVQGEPPLTQDPDRRVLSLLLDAVDDLVTTPLPTSMDTVAAFVGWPDPQRPGAPTRPVSVLLADLLSSRVKRGIDPNQVHCLTGETSGSRALVAAAQHLAKDREVDACLVAAADSWLTRDALRWLTKRCPLREAVVGKGMVPAEAGAALWLVREPPPEETVRLLGSDVTQGNRQAEGFHLGLAIERALSRAAVTLETVDHTVVDAGTDPWGFVECTLAMGRLSRRPWHGTMWSLADAIGNVGAPAGIISTLVAAHLLCRHGDGGTALSVVSGRRSRRVAVLLGADPRPTASARDEVPWAR